MDMLRFVKLHFLLSSVCVYSLDDETLAMSRLLRRIEMPSKRLDLLPSVQRDLELVLRHKYPGCKAEMFGSIAQDLNINGQSDIDFSITFHNNLTISKSDLVLETRNIMLQHQNLFQIRKIVPSARVPILSVEHLPTSFLMDVSFNNHIAVRKSKLVKYLLSLDDRAKRLTQIVKYWAKLKGISGYKSSSFGIVTMAIFYLQQKNVLPSINYLQKKSEEHFLKNWNTGFAEVNCVSSNNESFCDILGGFFRFYSEYQFDKYVASPFLGRPVRIENFKDVRNLAPEFHVYKTNVLLNVTRPLITKTPVVQDMFEHHFNVIRVFRDDLIQIFKSASRQFHYGCSQFLRDMLNPDPVKQVNRDDSIREHHAIETTVTNLSLSFPKGTCLFLNQFTYL